MADPWTELDRRNHGTRFIALQPKNVINSSSATKMALGRAAGTPGSAAVAKESEGRRQERELVKRREDLQMKLW